MESDQTVPSLDQPHTMPATFVISTKEFSVFKNFLDIIKSRFIDFVLLDGVFRARSNDYTCLVETGFPFLRGMNFDIVNIKETLKRFSIFKRRTEITFTANDTELIVTDGIAPLTITKPNPAFLDNKYFSDNEIEEFFKILDPSRQIVDATIPKNYVLRTKQLSRKRSPDYIHLKHDKTNLNKGFLFIPDESDKSTEVSINFEMNFDIPMIKNHCIQLPTFPFKFDNNVLYLKCFFNSDQTITAIFSTKMKDLFVNFYSRSALIPEDK